MKFDAIQMNDRPARDGALVSPRSELLFASLVVGWLNYAWIAFSDRFSLSLHPEMLALWLVAAVLVIVRYSRSAVFDPKLDAACRFCLFVVALSFAQSQLFVFSHLMMSFPMPLADSALQSWDAFLGFDWNAYAKWVSSDPWLRTVFLRAYTDGPVWGVVAILLVCLWLGRHDRLDELFFLFTTSALLCIVIAPFFPAEAPWQTVASPEVKALMGEELWGTWREQFHLIRNGDPVHFGTAPLAGLITFPSYHACMGLTVAWCSRGHPLGLGAGWLLGLCIIAATPVFGGHYLIDLIGGAAVMAVLLVLWHRGGVFFWRRQGVPSPL